MNSSGMLVKLLEGHAYGMQAGRQPLQYVMASRLTKCKQVHNLAACSGVIAQITQPYTCRHRQWKKLELQKLLVGLARAQHATAAVLLTGPWITALQSNQSSSAQHNTPVCSVCCFVLMHFIINRLAQASMHATLLHSSPAADAAECVKCVPCRRHRQHILTASAEQYVPQLTHVYTTPTSAERFHLLYMLRTLQAPCSNSMPCSAWAADIHVYATLHRKAVTGAATQCACILLLNMHCDFLLTYRSCVYPRRRILQMSRCTRRLH